MVIAFSMRKMRVIQWRRDIIAVFMSIRNTFAIDEEKRENFSMFCSIFRDRWGLWNFARIFLVVQESGIAVTNPSVICSHFLFSEMFFLFRW